MLKQFCRGGWDNQLIRFLQLEQLKDKAPSFAELLLSTEEDKQANNAAQMKQHLGIVNTKALSHSQITCMSSVDRFDLLLGSSATVSPAEVAVDGVNCCCLLDTGSQVTTIAMSFYKSHLSEHPIKPISNLLEVEGANGQIVPYLGYVETIIKFPKYFLETEPEFSTIALIVPDLRLNSDGAAANWYPYT